MSFARCLLCWGVLACALGEWIEGGATAGETKPVHSIRMMKSRCPCGKCQMAESRHFRVSYCTKPEVVANLARECEEFLAHFREQWGGDPGAGEAAEWSIRCEVVVHASVHSYRQYMGPGSERTSGCSTISLHQGEVTQRRIDVRVDAVDWKEESLPHEISHVALADRFKKTRIPSWADEGIAMLAESPEKLQRRVIEMHGHRQRGGGIPLRELMNLRQGVSAQQWGVYYGESLLLTGLLLEKGTPELFLSFVEEGEKRGYLSALKQVYAYETWEALEADWQQYAASDRIRLLSGHNVQGDVEPVGAVASREDQIVTPIKNQD